MISREKAFRKRILWNFLLFVLPGLSFGQNFIIQKIQPYLGADSLQVEISCDHIFEGKIRRTLLAGLPLILNFSLQLKNLHGKTLPLKKISLNIEYDVWEEIFQVTGFDKKIKRFGVIAELENWFRKLPVIPLLPVSELSDKEDYRLILKCRLILLTRKQSERLNFWLQNNQQSEEELPTQERNISFKLNLNRFIQLFISRGEKAEAFEVRAESARFQLTNLKTR